jgi:hypothetical protein
MTDEDMHAYLNSLAVQGANRTQSISQNFGVGAKITALFRNRFGLVYQSWRNGHGAMVRLHRDDERGVYGLLGIDTPSGVHFSPPIGDSAKPSIVFSHGTKVTLLGSSADENTCFHPDSSAVNWLLTYLNARYFRIPDNIKIQVRVLKRDDTQWPENEPSRSEKTFNLETVKGCKSVFDAMSGAGKGASGTVRLSGAEAHWWLFADGKQASKDMSPRGLRTGQVGIVFQDEVYVVRNPPSSRRILAGFGLIFGAEHVVIYVEPRGDVVHADTARSRVLIDGGDVEDGNYWERWGEEFKSRMPPEIRALIEELMARADRDPDGKARERILERLKRIRELMIPTRYRKDVDGPVSARTPVVGGTPLRSGVAREGGGSDRSGQNGGRSADAYLAELVELAGESAKEIRPVPSEPDVLWVSTADGSRDEDELVDKAAEIPDDALTGRVIKASRDFRGYRDLVEHFSKEFNPHGDPLITAKIVEHVDEWISSQLIESVMTVRNLYNGNTWTKAQIEQALSPEALTAVAMARFHVVERVSRSLRSELAKPQAA